MQTATAHNTRKRTPFNQNRLSGMKIYDYTVPVGAIYGTYVTTTDTIKYIFTDFTSMNTEEKSTVTIMVYDYSRRRWCGMELPKTNELIRFIKAGIAKLHLENTQVKSVRTIKKESRERRNYETVIHDGFNVKRTRKRQSTALPWNGSPNYYGLADNSNMTRNDAGEREFREKMKNNKLYS